MYASTLWRQAPSTRMKICDAQTATHRTLVTNPSLPCCRMFQSEFFKVWPNEKKITTCVQSRALRLGLSAQQDARETTQTRTRFTSITNIGAGQTARPHNNMKAISRDFATSTANSPQRQPTRKNLTQGQKHAPKRDGAQQRMIMSSIRRVDRMFSAQKCLKR